jgi:hypothetical protein
MDMMFIVDKYGGQPRFKQCHSASGHFYRYQEICTNIEKGIVAQKSTSPTDPTKRYVIIEVPLK